MTARPTHGARTLLSLLLIAGLVGCGESSTGPEEEAPTGPSVTGVWNGEFRGADTRMNLNQSGSNVTGTITVGVRTYPLTGTVDANGTFEWSSELREADCSRMGSPGLQLGDQASLLSGRMVRTSEAPPCDGGRTLVENGSVQMTKAF